LIGTLAVGVAGGAWQEPCAQRRPAPQAIPQAPQLAALLLRFVSQPLLELPSQSAKPVLQVATTAVWQFAPVKPVGHWQV
jgi:hypothetical protein